MKHIQIRKPDIKGFFHKIKNLKKEDVKAHWKERRERRQQILEQRRNSKFAKKMQPVYRFMDRISLILHFLLACVLNLLIEVISRHSLFEAWDYMVGSPKVFLFNAFLIFATFSVVYLVRRRLFARILLSVFWLFLGTCNGYLLLKRVTPFNAQDLKVLSDALALTGNYFNTFELILLIVGIAAVILWVISMWRRGGQYAGKMHRILALAGVVFWLGAYVFLTDVAIDKRVVSNYFGNIAFAYEDYGFPYCFTASIFNTGISEPAGYSEETMAKISNNGSITESTTGRTEETLPNIIFVQLESYFDPTEVEWLQFSEDPIPNLRKMYQEHSTGYFKVPSVGAGTANTEFEVLTGMSMRFFGPGEYPYKTYAKTKVLESAATALGKFGYGAEALHNNGGNFYSRAQVFNHMGFDHYTSKEFMNILQTTPKGWATDDILIPNIMDSMDTTEQQDFVFTISVQGHGDYPTEKMIENPEIVVSGVEDEGKRNSWEYYVNEVYEMDKFAGDLVKAVEQRNEPSVIVFYGDHLPTMGLEAKDLKSRYLYNTNYVIWDNIGLEKEDRNIPAYQIMADVFERLDIHSGTIFNYHQQRRQTKNYLADLELLQYDILYGKQYVYKDSGQPITEGHMVMGVNDAAVTELVSQLDGTYSIYGENFTKQSKVYINGEKQSSTFLNNTRIDLKEASLEDGDILQVCQVGSSNTIFRSSREYKYEGGKLTELPLTIGGVEPGREAFAEQETGEEK
ncbi:MAG: LTA synthase family protein [Clostridium sp.]|uniref:Phosphoglycerol transferase and related proteins, alkaline phosphatase superfamily n=1 Tax=Faecalicatena contorta TaxID=39482 RepID=A0A174J4F2_9FIRM|nr:MULTISPECIES: LTA synthase family protein [Clostridia]MBS6764833.1 sulfatase-like hydrolase/transferase [Clostridium sp.]MDU7707020.1 LTA synthase family protein [Clostridium sp.]CUO93531.1 Phosphoglycerol transferase and related proteins%2C alkaline phosphatase superfamily [[Eubacterium] contortum] [Faecalicatena contorta]